MSEPNSGSANPGVSYVMPVLNEVGHVLAAVESLLTQDYSGPFEVILALAPSIDGTAELVAELSERDQRIRVLDNPVGSTPSGLNIAIKASRYSVVVRVDAHSVLPPHYTRTAVATLQRTGAANVGGLMAARGETAFETAVATAYGSRIGLGGTRLHLGGEEGPAETVYLGVFDRDALFAAGLFDEGIKRGQDWELNQRLRLGGGVVWFTPALHVDYRPRPSLSSLARQFFSTGLWRGELMRRMPRASSLRYLAPPTLATLLAIGTLLGIGGIVEAALSVHPWLLLGFIVPAVYLLAVLAACFALTLAPHASTVRGWQARASFAVVLPCIHVAWGTGFILGSLALTRNITAHTGR